MRKLLIFAAATLFTAPAFAAALTVQTSTFDGLHYSSAAVSSSDSFSNNGKTFLLFKTTASTNRTLTIGANDADKPGFGTIVVPDTTVTIFSSAANGGATLVGPFPADRFNDSTGSVVYTIDATTNTWVSAITLPSYP